MLARNECTDSEQMERLGPEETDHVTMAAKVDVSELAPSEVNRLIEMARTFEREFSALAWSKGVKVRNYDPSQKNHADGEGFPWIDADYVTMAVTVDALAQDGTETGMLMEKAGEFENEFREIVEDVREKRAS